MNRIRYIVLLLLLPLFSEAHGAIFRGYVVDVDGEAVEGASIYFHELKMGTSTDEDGLFLVVLEPGRYTCEISSLGYKRVKFSIDVFSDDIDRRIVLEDEVVELDPVYLKAGGKEDRSYTVMRKAIARAPYHRAQIRQYEADTYIKGNIIVTKIPKLVQAQLKKNKLDLAVNKRFVAESFSKVTFDYPDKYHEDILAVNNSIPMDLDVINLSVFMRYSIYQPEVYGRLSPLAPNAFNHYSFEYLGMVAEEGRLVNKIKIIPRKKKDPKLISGVIYIVEDSWDVLYAAVEASEMGVTLNLKMYYNEIIPGLLIPTTYDVDATVDVMGVKGNGKYYSSLTYKLINSIDPELAKRQSSEKTDSAPVKLGDNITTKEAKKIASKTESIINKEITEKERADSQMDVKARSGEEQIVAVKRRDDLEVKIDPLITTKMDTSAKIRSDDYWAKIRTIPLKEDETQSYSERDSLKKRVDRVLAQDSTLFRSTGNGTLDKSLYGGDFNIGRGFSIGIGGLINVVRDFNFVDGYQVGQNFYFRKRFGDYTSFKIGPSLYYATHSKELSWEVASSLRFDPIRRGNLSIKIGEGSSDISNNPSMPRIVNAFSGFLFGISPVKYDARRYLEGSFGIDVANGLRFNGGVGIERRSPLSQLDVNSLFGSRPASNVPDNYLDPLIVMHNSLYYDLSLSYTPYHRYYISDGRKRYLNPDWPTFTLYNRASIAQFNNRSSSYGMVGASVKHRIKVGMRNTIRYNLDGGTFYNRDNVYLNDYKFFNATNTIYTTGNFTDSFLLLDHYKYATPKSWVTLSTEYTSDFIALKYLPFINSPLIYESLHLKGVWLPEDKITHFEVGYSMNIADQIKAGVFVGFDDFKFGGVAFRLGVPFPF